MLAKKQVEEIRTDLDSDRSRLPVLFNALGDPVRYQIFKLLMRGEGICVSDIATILKVSAPAASYQLKMLEMVGLIQRERQGKMICYIVRKDDPVVKSVVRMVKK